MTQSQGTTVSTAPFSGEKILVTGAAGQIAFPLVEFLAKDNEVWGLARFSGDGARAKVEAVGAKTITCDLGEGDLAGLPDDFTYVLHLAAFMAGGLDFDHAYRVNAEGTGLLLQHCRRAKAALVMSTHSVYRPVEDPHHLWLETDPVGEVNSQHAPTYSMSKLGQEAVARACARMFELPVTIARMNASYGPNGGLPMYQMEAAIAANPVVTRWDPCMYSPIHQDDINAQTAPLLRAATVPATVVNWAGDEGVSVQQWCAYAGELVGRVGATAPTVVSQPIADTLRGSVASSAKRAAITGPCAVDWRTGTRQSLEARGSVPRS